MFASRRANAFPAASSPPSRISTHSFSHSRSFWIEMSSWRPSRVPNAPYGQMLGWLSPPLFGGKLGKRLTFLGRSPREKFKLFSETFNRRVKNLPLRGRARVALLQVRHRHLLRQGVKKRDPNGRPPPGLPRSCGALAAEKGALHGRVAVQPGADVRQAA